MKRILSLCLCAVMLAAVLAGCGNSAGTQEAEPAAEAEESTEESAEEEAEAPAESTGDPILIGVISPMTGDTAFLGETVKGIFEYLKEETNSEGGVNGRPIDFIYEDDQGTSAGAATAAKKLIDVDGVSAICGPLFTSAILGMKDLALEAEVPVMIATSSSPEIFGEGHEGNYLFTLDVAPDIVCRNEVSYWIDKLGFKKVAMLSQQNDQTTAKYEYFREMVPEKGGEIVSEATFNAGNDDFRTALTAIKAAGAEVIYMNVDRDELVKIVRQMNELDMDTWISTDYQAIQDDVFAEIGELVDGRLDYALVGTASDDFTRGLYEAFEADFKAKTGAEQVEAFGSVLYDCGKILVTAMRDSGATTGKDLRDYLASIQDYAGITGYTTLQDNGTSNRSSAINIYKNGEVILDQLVNGTEFVALEGGEDAAPAEEPAA